MFWKNIVPKLHQYESSEEETTTTQAPWTFLKNNCMINLVFFVAQTIDSLRLQANIYFGYVIYCGGSGVESLIE